MPNVISHHCLEPQTHVLVAEDGQPREARYLTRYDDGTEGETIHRLYMEEGEVRSEYVRDDPA